jgi:pimeloyl-ACP methyl ester carboxylesterase
MVSTPRQATHFIECGPADGPLIVFLHGWPSIGLMWRAQMEAFAADGWRCFDPDLRGYGGSSAPTATEPTASSKSSQTWRNSMRAVDRSGPHATRLAALAGMAIAWALLAVFKGNLAGMVVGLIILDVSTTIVEHREPHHPLRSGRGRPDTPERRLPDRPCFFEGAIMSALVGLCWSFGGWFALCALGAIPFLRCRRGVW